MAGKKGRDDIATGITMCLVFGFLWRFQGSGLWMLLFIFLGVVPLIKGWFARLEQRDLMKEQEKIIHKSSSQKEKELLRAAKKNNGILTPALAALQMDCSIEEIEKQLRDLASRGYVNMEVTDEGRVEYHFPDFKPSLE